MQHIKNIFQQKYITWFSWRKEKVVFEVFSEDYECDP